MDGWHIFLIVIAISLALSLWSRSNDGDNETQILRVERKLDLLLKHFDIEEQGYSSDDIVNLALSGRKLEAMRVYRDLHPNAGLMEAKRVVEDLIRQHRTR
jgi:ribosomal protein L7/L12